MDDEWEYAEGKLSLKHVEEHDSEKKWSQQLLDSNEGKTLWHSAYEVHGAFRGVLCTQVRYIAVLL